MLRPRSEGSSEGDNRDGGGIAKVSDGSVCGGGGGEAVMIKVGITVMVVATATTVAASQEWIIIISL
jgi:hypothetical protein